jgi:hypothetical protein
MARSSPPVPTPPAPGRPFEPLLPRWVKPLAGGTVIGLLVGAALGVAITAVKLSAKPPPPVSTAPIVVPSQFEPLPIRSPGVLGPIVAGAHGTFDASGVTFDYPEDWQNMTRVVAAHPPHGRPLWNAVLGSGQGEVAVVAAYPGRDPGTDAARKRQTELIAQDVAEQLGATFTGRIGNFGPRLLPAFGYSIVGAAQQGRPPWRVDAYVLFEPHTRYVVQCQTPGANPSPFARGCAQILSSFRPTGTGVGAATPLEAARRFYESGASGRLDLAHQVATDYAAKQIVALWDPNRMPPTTCAPSDADGGQMCTASNPGETSIQFEVNKVGDRWFVTRVFDCTLYGNERDCWSFSP